MEPLEPGQPDVVQTHENASVAQAVAEPPAEQIESAITHRNLAEWHGSELIDRDGERIGKLEDVYYDVETDEPQFGSVKEGLFGRRLTFVPLGDVTIGPDSLQVPVTKAQVRAAPKVVLHDLSQVDESRLYHHYELNYTALQTESTRRLARR